MSLLKREVQLNWERPAGQMPVHKIAIHIDNIAPDKGESVPSSKYGFPHPVFVEGRILGSDLRQWNEKRARLRLPQEETLDIHVGDKIAIGVTAAEDGRNNGMCMEKLPSSLKDDEIDAWLDTWQYRPDHV